MRSEEDLALEQRCVEKLRRGYVRRRSVSTAKAKIVGGLADNSVAIDGATDRVLQVIRADAIADEVARAIHRAA